MLKIPLSSQPLGRILNAIRPATLPPKWNRPLRHDDNGSLNSNRFEYEYHTDSGQWYRAYGNENREFDEPGYMKFRFASINDLPIKESERKFRWERKS